MQVDSVLSRVLPQGIKFFLQLIFLQLLERMGQCWKEWDNVGKNGTTFQAFFVPFFPTPLYVNVFSGGRRGSSNRSQQDFEWDDGIMSDRDLLGHKDDFRGGQGGKRGGYDRDGPY